MQVVYPTHAGAVLPRAAAADEERSAQAADRDDAEVAAAPSAGDVAARRSDRTAASSRCCTTSPPSADVKRVVLTSRQGLLRPQARRATKRARTSPIIRLEQFYPFPQPMLADALQQYPNATEIVWVQEEPRNMGAWPFLHERLGCCSSRTRRCATSAVRSARRRRPARIIGTRSSRRRSSKQRFRSVVAGALARPAGGGARHHTLLRSSLQQRLGVECLRAVLGAHGIARRIHRHARVFAAWR